MTISIVSEEEPYRLINDGQGRWAVVEARGGRVFSLHARKRREAEDTPQGMVAVVDPDGWRAESTARRRFRSMTRTEERYSKVIW